MVLKYVTYLIIVLLVGKSCQPNLKHAKIDLKFNANKWKIKEGMDFPYREQMLDSVIYNDSIRALTKSQLIQTLGEPNRMQDSHLYYTINQTFLGAWPLHKKTMVIKLTSKDQVEWIKIHE